MHSDVLKEIIQMYQDKFYKLNNTSAAKLEEIDNIIKELIQTNYPNK